MHARVTTLSPLLVSDDDGMWRLMFGVKYYIEDPSVFKEDITRYQYVLQLCQDIRDQRWGRGEVGVRRVWRRGGWV